MKNLMKLAAGAALALTLGTQMAAAQVKIGFAWEVEIKDALCAQITEGCEVVEIAWDGIIPALLSKKIDAIVASMSITEERSKTIAFSNKYYNTPAVLVAAKGRKALRISHHQELLHV